MAWHFAMMIDPAASNDQRGDFSETFSRLDPAKPALSIGELSAQRGDGVFESIGVIDAHAQEVQAHLQRLAHSAHLCDLAAPHPGQWRAAIALAAAACPVGESVIKLIVSRGIESGPSPTAWITASSATDFTEARQHGIRVITLDRGLHSAATDRSPWLLLGAKTLSYGVNMAALREAKRRGADDAIFVSSDGFVLEAPTASVLLKMGDRFVTPAPSGAILHGTTQISVFSYLESRGIEASYDAVSAADLSRVDAAWLLSSLRLAAPIVCIDGIEIPHDRSFTAELNAYLLAPRD